MKLLLVGAGGFALYYLKILLNQELPGVIFEGIVDPFYSKSPYKEAIDAADIPVYNTMKEFYSSHKADIAIICTPTYLHCEQSVYAVKNGSNVLCEKPAAPTVKEVEEMMKAEKEFGRFIAVGYQWSYSEAMMKLKTDIINGLFGKPVYFKTAISWPRDITYYNRGGGWAGKIKKDGRLVLDSIVSNACAHYLHNMLFVLGNTLETSASVTNLRAECYRANEIENFDTCCIKMETQCGAELYFAATHAAKHNCNPEFIYAFSNGKVFFSEDKGSQIVAEFNDGSKKVYGNPFENSFKKVWDCIDAARNGTVPICTVQTALPHVEVVETIYKTIPIGNFSKQHIYKDLEQNAVYVRGFFESFYNAYEKGKLFSELCPEFFEKNKP